MSEYSFYQALLYSYIGLAAITALYLLKITAPYGRHARSAVSAHDLPFGIAVEIEMVAEVDYSA